MNELAHGIIGVVGSVGLVWCVIEVIRETLRMLEHDGWEDAFRLVAEDVAQRWVIEVHEDHVEHDPMRERRGLVGSTTHTIGS